MRLAFTRFLRYITNNEEVSRHEFDAAFFIINTLAVVVGSIYIG